MRCARPRRHWRTSTRGRVPGHGRAMCHFTSHSLFIREGAKRDAAGFTTGIVSGECFPLLSFLFACQYQRRSAQHGEDYREIRDQPHLFISIIGWSCNASCAQLKFLALAGTQQSNHASKNIKLNIIIYKGRCHWRLLLLVVLHRGFPRRLRLILLFNNQLGRLARWIINRPRSAEFT